MKKRLSAGVWWVLLLSLLFTKSISTETRERVGIHCHNGGKAGNRGEGRSRIIWQEEGP